MRCNSAYTAAIVGGMLLVGACADGGDNASTESAPTQSPTTQQSFNDADVSFAQQMIPHHQQAIEMAQLAQERADSDDVRELAAGIEQAQAPEIDTMTTWLREWGEDVPADMGDGMSMDQVPGMMTDQDMDQLMATSGPEFDQMFLTMMIAHHEGAIDMARTEQADGQNPDAIALAEKIEADQTAEIDTIRELLGS